MKNINIKKEIRSLISYQSTSLKGILNNVGPEYDRAVKLLLGCRGKVIVTGVGKSGLIAQKIASTFSSTGTPAIYLHPNEGMHGSLGVVSKNDVVVAMGKSGESEEILKILPSIKKIGAKVISITSNLMSTLSKQSNVAIHVPVKREACPLNLAPTTSSTNALVVGDALAIVLMKKKGFGPDKFALYHPGGLLGKKLLLTVQDVMRSGKNNPRVRLNSSMVRLLIEISKKWAGAASVVDKNNKLVGVVTDFDIRKAFAQGKKISDMTIKDIMNKKPKSIYSDEMAIKALAFMEGRKKPFTVLPVIDRKKRSVGMIHLHDLVRNGLISEKK